MSNSKLKKQIIYAFDALAESNPGAKLVITTQGGIILGNLPTDEDFEKNSLCKGYADAIRQLREGETNDDNENLQFIGLVDATVVNGNSQNRLSFMIVFLDQILGVSLGYPLQDQDSD